MVCFLRYAQVIEHSHRCWVNTSALVSGCTNAIGLVMVGNFQVSINYTYTDLNRLDPVIFNAAIVVSMSKRSKLAS